MKPLPKDRARGVVGKNKKTKKLFVAQRTTDRTKWYEQQISEYTAEQHQRFEPFEADLTMFVAFYFENRVHGDLDNCVKAIWDGMQGVAFTNDKQIKEFHVSTTYGARKPRTEVIIMPWTPRLEEPEPKGEDQ